MAARKNSLDEDLNEDDGFISNLTSRLKKFFDIKSNEVEKILSTPDLDGIVEYIKSGRCKKIITMVGAGISTSAGIPDFRSPNSGLYDNLGEYNLPNPMAIFDISYFQKNPEPFFVLAKKLFPKEFEPTLSHKFIKLLDDNVLLLRHYTQNVDTLEHKVGLPESKIVEAHGSFKKSHCLGCKTEYSYEWTKEKVFSDTVPKCEKEGCGKVVKPDIVFFGEALPAHFYKCVVKDFDECDLLIIMGTSLTVQPFASLVSNVGKNVPRLYINRDQPPGFSIANIILGSPKFAFGNRNNYRDVFLQGNCDDVCQQLAQKLNWMV